MARCALVNRGLRDVVGAVPYRLYVVGMLVADLGAVGQQTAWRFAERIACDSLTSPPTDLCVVGALVADTPHPSACGCHLPPLGKANRCQILANRRLIPRNSQVSANSPTSAESADFSSLLQRDEGERIRLRILSTERIAFCKGHACGG